MIFFPFDIEWFEDPLYLELKDADRGHPDRWTRCVAWAHRANEKGRIMRADGVPMDARAMARVADGNTQPKTVATWEHFLTLCTKIGLLIVCDKTGCYQINHWRRWHRSPSGYPERVAERVNKHRSGKTGEQTGSNVTSCNASVTSCNGCNDTDPDPESDTESESESDTDPESDTDTDTDPESSSLRRTRRRKPANAGRSPGAGAPSPRDNAGGAPPATPPEESRDVGFAAQELQGLSKRILNFKEQRRISLWQTEALAAHPWPVVQDAVLAARDQTLDRIQAGDIRQPLAYALSLLPEALETAAQHHQAQESRRKVGLSTTPYRWQPEED